MNLPWDGAVAEPVDEGHPKPLIHNGIQNPSHPSPRPGNPPPFPTVGSGRFQACNRLKSGFPRNAYEPRQPVCTAGMQSRGLESIISSSIINNSSVIHVSSVIHERDPGLKPCGSCSDFHLWVMGDVWVIPVVMGDRG